MRLNLIYCYLLFFCTVAVAQDSKQDSLQLLLDKETKSNLRSDYLLQLAKSVYEKSHDEYLQYSKEALEETKRADFDNDTLKMKVTNNVGCAYSEINETKLANQHFFDAVDLAIKIDDKHYLSNLYNNIGLTYGNVQEFDKAIEFHLKSLKIKEERNDSLGLSISYTNIGAVYYHIKAHDKAKSFFEKSFDISKAIDDTEGVAFGYTNLGDVMMAEGKFETAIDYYHQYVNMVKELGFNHSILYGHKKLGESYIELNNLQKALMHTEIAYEMALEFNYTWELTNICLLYAKLKKQQNSYEEALFYAEEALKYFPNSTSKKKLAQIHLTLSSIYEGLEDIPSALDHLKQHQVELDSAIQKENMETFAEMEAKFQVQLKEKENSHLKAEQTLNERIIAQRTVLAILGLLGVLLLAYLVYRLHHEKNEKHQLNLLLEKKVETRTEHLQQLNKELQRANVELERFSYITSHDLREPLRSIMGFSNLAKRRFKENRYEDAAEYLSFIERGIIQMEALLRDIMEFSSIERRTDYKMLLLGQLIKKTRFELSPLLKDKNASIRLLPSSVDAAVSFPDPLYTVFKNLVENAIKYNENLKPEITISVYETPKSYKFTFQDNGIGIAEEYQQHVFEMFKRLHSREKYTGSGIGLSICKKIIQKLGGDIIILNSDANGTTFEFWVNKSLVSDIAISKHKDLPSNV